MSHTSYSKNNPVVNILTWWDYLNVGDIKKTIENDCKCTISYDEYYSTNDFLKRYANQAAQYDILIFSDSIYQVMKDNLPKIKVDVKDILKKYHPSVRKHYNDQQYTDNMMIFDMATSGFLYNKKNTQIEGSDKIDDLFNKSKDKVVSIGDDYAEVYTLFGKIPSPLDFKRYKSHVKDLIITNKLDRIPYDKDFSFSYSWSGETLVYLVNQDNSDLDLFVHQDLSHISKDIVVMILDSPEKRCVYKRLVSEDIVKKVTESELYFSPFGPQDRKNSVFKKVEADFFSKIEKLKWLNINEGKLPHYIDRQWENTRGAI